MKWGRLLFFREFVSPTVCNVGDIAQSFAIDYIYLKMGIPKDDIVDISIHQLSTYRGEKILLPLDGYFRYSREYSVFPTSPDITPVFLGVYIPPGPYQKATKFWTQFSPIGCRDEATFCAMRNHGYDAYLTGCMTMLFPKRDKVPSTPHVFMVDAHPAIYNFIPEDLKPYIERITHDITVNPDEDWMAVGHTCEKIARSIYHRYWEEATLVVTSRLHCAAPCIAMGIPTIVVKDGFDERFGWLDRFTHLYTKEEFGLINWAPDPVDLEVHKDRLLCAAMSMINQQPDRELLQEIHEFYMTRDRSVLKSSVLVDGYMWLAQYFPKLASFIREKVLLRFTIVGKSLGE